MMYDAREFNTIQRLPESKYCNL